MDKSILLCFAHPDDEVGCAPIVARYIAEGAKATLICATNGDVGDVEEKYLRDYPDIPTLRLPNSTAPPKPSATPKLSPLATATAA